MAMAETGLPTKDPRTSPSEASRPPGLGGSGLRGALTAGTYNRQPIWSLSILQPDPPFLAWVLTTDMGAENVLL